MTTLDFRPAEVNIKWCPGTDITWRVIIEDDGIEVGAVDARVGNLVPALSTAESVVGQLIVDVSLTSAQTAVFGQLAERWWLEHVSPLGVRTRWVVGIARGDLDGNYIPGGEHRIVSAAGAATVTTLVGGDAAASLAAHVAAADPHPGYLTSAEAAAAYDPAGSSAAAQAAAASALAAHSADTTNVHGIPDTTALLDTADIGVSVQGFSAVLAATTASFTAADETKLDAIEPGATADQTPAEILSALLTVDGAGSGLDADLLDGNSSAAFQLVSGRGQANGYASLDPSGLIPDGQIPSGIARDSEVAAAVAAAIDGLLAGAPGALDTLNELAAAIGDDANFASTVTTALAGKQPLAATLTAIAALTTTSFGRSLLEVASSSALRTAAGLVIGTDVQAYDAELAAIAALASAADRLPYFTGSGTAALATFTAAGRALVDDADVAAQRTTLGLGALAVESTITSSLITDGTIVNADINASAAIAGTKVDAATDSVRGAVELATSTETATGTDTARAVTPAGLAVLNRWIESRRRWGILNGGGDLGDMTGWANYADLSAAATYSWDAADGSFLGTIQYASMSSELVFIDSARDVVVTYYYNPGRTGDHVATLAYYDADQLSIRTGMTQAVVGSTQTTLAANLNNGDTTITLADATGWYEGANSWDRTITLWPYTDGQGKAWDDYTYSRNMLADAWAAGGITGNVITLSTPWAGGSFPSGSAVWNGNNADYAVTYVEVFPAVTPGTWYRVRSTIAYTSLLAAARYATFGVISNYAGAGVDSRVRAVSLSQQY